MTKRDCILLAQVLTQAGKRSHYQGMAPLDGVKIVVTKLCDMLKKDNANFNEEKFLNALDFEVE